MPNKSTPSPQSFAVFETYKQAINTSLSDYFKTLPTSFAVYDLPPIAQHALTLIAEYTLRPGKRVRGALAAMAYDNLTGKKMSVSGQKLAIVMELIQSCALIEDDVTDKSDLRRGEPTVHRLYERYDKHIGSRDAEQLAFYTGTITGYVANLVLLNIDEAAENLAKALSCVQKNITITSFGQLDDIMQEIGRQASADDIIRKYLLKTSHYTFVNPLHAGMALAGLEDKIAYHEVEKFGEAAGVAFQTHDDYLGVYGGDETGKPVIDDIKEGKLTILVQYALEHGTPEDMKTLRRYLGNSSIGDAELAKTRAILDRSGATMEARRVEQQYADQAIKQLQSVTIWDEAFKSLLAELVMYSINRKS